MPHIVPFLAVATVLVIVPGADMALVTKNTVANGRRAGLLTVAGVICGLAVHGTGAAIGLSAVIAASAGAFQIIKTVGAIYLIVLGVRAIIAAVRGQTSAHQTHASETANPRATPFVEGLVTNVLNPKLVVFFLSLMPQFINDNAAAIPQIMLLTLLYAVLGAVWLVGYVAIVDRVKNQLQRPAMRRALDALSGTVLVALGLRLVTERA